MCQDTSIDPVGLDGCIGDGFDFFGVGKHYPLDIIAQQIVHEGPITGGFQHGKGLLRYKLIEIFRNFRV